ncbi:hypothetical protein MUP95_00690, partial [bacterium]|nr:hypothetical protein [bacterium]
RTLSIFSPTLYAGITTPTFMRNILTLNNSIKLLKNSFIFFVIPNPFRDLSSRGPETMLK